MLWGLIMKPCLLQLGITRCSFFRTLTLCSFSFRFFTFAFPPAYFYKACRRCRTRSEDCFAFRAHCTLHTECHWYLVSDRVVDSKKDSYCSFKGYPAVLFRGMWVRGGFSGI